jgi:thiol:disulfide interchange protein DsbD
MVSGKALKIGLPIILMLCWGLSAARANDIVSVHSAWSLDQGRPGDVLDLAVVLSVAKGYHINPDAHQITASKDFVPYPTRVQVVKADKRFRLSSSVYPPAHFISANYGSGYLPAFQGQVIIYLPIKIDEDSQPGPAAIDLRVSYQACDEHNCYIPENVALKATLPIVGKDQATRPVNATLFKSRPPRTEPSTATKVTFELFKWTFEIDVTTLLGQALLLTVAAWGGLLLNFTPCVLPLIPIKIMSLSNSAQNRRRCLALGIFMSTGVVAFWLLLALMIALISDFTATNQLFHYPFFTIAVGGIIAIMAVGMCGLFSIPLPNFLYRMTPRQETLPGSFGMGIMTAILSTPCTAPFMGAAAAWAATQHPATTLSTFAAIGIGMALPYLILSASPALVTRMPRSGPAGILIKQVMGLLMLAAASYFIGTGISAWFTNPPDPPSKAYWWVVMAFSASAGGWLIYRTLNIASRLINRILFAAIGILMIAVSWWGIVPLTSSGPIDWVSYTPQRFEAALKQGKIVVLDFTAEWCLNCKALEAGVLRKPNIARLLSADDIVSFKVDLTARNPAGKAKLKQVGQLTIPLLVVYGPAGKLIFKSDFYTPEQIEHAIRKARRSYE